MMSWKRSKKSMKSFPVSREFPSSMTRPTRRRAGGGIRPGGGNKHHESWQRPALFRAGVEYPLAVAHNIFNHKEQYFGSGKDVIR